MSCQPRAGETARRRRRKAAAALGAGPWRGVDRVVGAGAAAVPWALTSLLSRRLRRELS